MLRRSGVPAASRTSTRFADAFDQDQPAAGAQFLIASGMQGGENSNAGLIPTAMLSSMFGQMMPGPLEKLKSEREATRHGCASAIALQLLQCSGIIWRTSSSARGRDQARIAVLAALHARHQELAPAAG